MDTFLALPYLALAIRMIKFYRHARVASLQLMALFLAHSESLAPLAPPAPLAPLFQQQPSGQDDVLTFNHTLRLEISLVLFGLPTRSKPQMQNMILAPSHGALRSVTIMRDGNARHSSAMLGDEGDVAQAFRHACPPQMRKAHTWALPLSM